MTPLPNIHTFRWSVRKHRTNLNWGLFYRTLDNSAKASRSRKDLKKKKKKGHWLQEAKETLYRLIWILKQKRSDTGEIQIQSTMLVNSIAPKLVSWFWSVFCGYVSCEHQRKLVERCKGHMYSLCKFSVNLKIWHYYQRWGWREEGLEEGGQKGTDVQL